MSGDGHVTKDFRFKGYPTQSMVSPRQPFKAAVPEDRKRNEEKLIKYFGKPSLFDPSQSNVRETTTRREPLALRRLEDIYSNRREEDIERIKRERQDMEEEIQRMKEKQSREIQDKENERKKNSELSNNFLWDQRSHGHGGPNSSGNYRRRQFVETNPAPFYPEGKNEEISLNNSRVSQGSTRGQSGEQKSMADPRGFQLFHNPERSEPQTPFELQEYSRILSEVSDQKKRLKQQQQQPFPFQQTDMISLEGPKEGYHDQLNGYNLDGFPDEKRSLDLENTRGGAGAPEKDERGKSVTRRPITLSRDNYGETRVREDFPRIKTGDPNERDLLYSVDNKPYYPWGSPGGGAPIRDREGRVITQVFGKLEGKDPKDEEYRKDKLRKAVFYNELKEVERTQKENKQELTRYLKAPQVEMAELLAAGRVGKPKRDEMTGEITQQHLGHSDVVKTKTNYQPKPVNEKKQYHDELVRMAEERQYQKLLDKFKERQESNAHFQNMDSSWGQFGGGAPKHQVIRKKVNLTNALFHPGQASGQTSSRNTGHSPAEDLEAYPSYPGNIPTGLGSFEFLEHQAHHNAGYQKRYSDADQRQFHSPENSPRYVKDTVNSSHKNLYQNSTDYKYMGRPGQTMAPYATGMM